MIRILSDENVHADIVSGLRREGFDLVTAVESGLGGRKDVEILDYAENHDLLLLTGDKDFGGLIEFGRLWGRGRVLLLRYQLLNVGKIVEDIARTLHSESENLSQNRPFVIVLSKSCQAWVSVLPIREPPSPNFLIPQSLNPQSPNLLLPISAQGRFR